MAKNIKALIIALVLIALLIGGYQGARVYQASKQRKAWENQTFPSQDYISLTSFEQKDLVKIELPGEGVSLERTADDLWEAVPAFPGPLNQGEIRSAVWSLASMMSERVIDEDPQDLSVYGLDVPTGRLIITKRDGEGVEFLGGGMTPSRNGYYVMVKGDPKVYLVSSYSGQAIYLDAARIRDKTLFPSSFDPQEIERLVLESGGTRIDIIVRPEDAFMIAPFSSYLMTAPYVVSRGVASEKFVPVLEALQNAAILDFVDPRPASLGPYGLDAPLRVYIETPGGNFDLLLGKSELGQRYAQWKGAAEVFTIGDIEPLAAITPFELMDKFALIVSIDTVNSFTVRGGGSLLTGEIRRRGEEETYFFNGKQVEEKSFKGWYQTVIGLLIDGEHPRHPQQGGTAEIVVEYLLNKPAGAKASIGLLPYDRDFYALEAGGVVEFLVSRAQVRTLYDTAEKMVYTE